MFGDEERIFIIYYVFIKVETACSYGIKMYLFLLLFFMSFNKNCKFLLVLLRCRQLKQSLLIRCKFKSKHIKEIVFSYLFTKRITKDS